MESFLQQEISQLSICTQQKFIQQLLGLGFCFYFPFLILFCRQTAIGACSSVARIGGIAAPYIALYLPDIQKQLPMLILGGSSLIGGFMAFALPETLGSNLPEKIDDVRVLKQNQKPLCSCVNPKTMA